MAQGGSEWRTIRRAIRLHGGKVSAQTIGELRRILKLRGMSTKTLEQNLRGMAKASEIVFKRHQGTMEVICS